MIKPIVGIGIVNLIVLSQSAIALAVTVQDILNPRRVNSWVADTADLLTPQTEAEINRIATGLETKNGSEIAVVTVPTTKPSQSSKAFATELFNTWKIGKQGKNNGVLFLISKNDRRTEIETGTGLTTLLPSSKVEIILTQKVTPQYKQGKFDQGTLAGTLAIAQALDSSPTSNNSAQASDAMNTRWNLLLWLLAGGFTVAFFFPVHAIVSKIAKGLRSRNLVKQGPRTSNDSSSSSSDWDSSYISSSNSSSSYSSSNSPSSSSSSNSPSSSSSSNSPSSYSSSDSSSSDSSSSYSSSSDSGSSDFGGGSSDGGGSGGSW
ncbi:TPM domain-containing protein [Phormidium sp. CLA17]|uniref:TPM domain-containing protein n=1 Tax=Leptolyngbya sp. Cla-17 TaxID=2803751 RepID=UPI00149172AD|nr:TPM domain-containing protein [Leptolyngbya sp. Cla-17]MBM0740944.1 TPM domain-containing protein [Leptolyngbya sp. Cla-17]